MKSRYTMRDSEHFIMPAPEDVRTLPCAYYYTSYIFSTNKPKKLSEGDCVDYKHKTENQTKPSAIYPVHAHDFSVYLFQRISSRTFRSWNSSSDTSSMVGVKCLPGLEVHSNPSF
ncbi:hypothetical protein BDY21DRAFT_349447 [Lineolata rhizophorae]|uniref:Uncharacterized protein n=1 Tax=Lineolata rhizophorae TaxID=578093 RepID=A0A6A6NUL3_9PEZI|nr:hypothetical protein BDY21DRAFT_349447 [Lineolata rhizophorae]